MTWLLERYGSPAALRKAGRRRLVEVIWPQAPRMAARLIDELFNALDEQTVVVPGTGTLDIVIPSLARSLAAVHEQRRALEAQIEALLEAPPLSVVLTSMPGVAVRTAAVLLVTVGDGASFPTAAHLASYAGLAPTTKSSGTSIHGEHAPRGGNRQLKRAMFLWGEQSYKQIKDELGWPKAQVRSDAAIRRHQSLVNCAFSFCWDIWFAPPPPATDLPPEPPALPGPAERGEPRPQPAC